MMDVLGGSVFLYVIQFCPGISGPINRLHLPDEKLSPMKYNYL